MTDVVLDAARRGDEGAFGELVGPYRRELQAHAYRMLGSVVDAEDAVQDAMLRAWRGLSGFEGRSSLRNWLYRITTNASLKLLERRPKRVLPIDYGPAADPHDGPSEPLLESIWLEPLPDDWLGMGALPSSPEAVYEQREGVELAFTAALQHLPPQQRAVLILRDVLAFSTREVAETLDITPDAVDSTLRRARKTVADRRPGPSQQATLRSIDDAELRDIVNRFVAAWESTNVDAVVALLADDARITMPPLPSWFDGRDAVGTFLRGWILSAGARWRLVPLRVNGQLAFAGYAWNEPARAFLPNCLNVLTLRGAEIQEMTAFLDSDAFRRTGLPGQLPS
jgi:RNA polymerase sigma-70 factor (ECF subfamily)